MAETQKETNQHEEHVHGENCDHPEQEKKNQPSPEELLRNLQMQSGLGGVPHKKKKEEKKFVKLMKKQKLKQLEGITRVTMRTNKNLVMYIDNPVIMTSGNE